MPELPEVETTLRGLERHLAVKVVRSVKIRYHQLRWPIPSQLKTVLKNQSLQAFSRRGKYLLLHFEHGTLIIHLGMSGRLRILTQAIAAQKHDHVDIIFSSGEILRYTDPRRFGAILWTDADANQHPLLKDLGIEPLEKTFSAKWLFQSIQKSNTPIKSFIMNAKIVVGIGNIYAAEALFLAKIHPLQPSKSLALEQCDCLVKAIKIILKQAIQRGGTTLKDFMNSEGKPGYFSQQLKVYARQQQPCVACQSLIQLIKLGQRSSAFCPSCQVLF